MKAKITLLIAFSLMLSVSMMGQLQYKWSQSIGSDQSDNPGRVIADDDGNYYSQMLINGTTDFDPGPGSDIVNTSGSRVNTISKVDPDGNHMWVRAFSSIAGIDVYGTILEANQNEIIITTLFTDSLYIDGGGERLFTYYAPGPQLGLARLTPEGDIINVVNYNAANSFFISHLTTLPNGNMLLSGNYSEILDFPGATPIAEKGKEDIFLILVNSKGDVIWSRVFGSKGYDYPSKMLVYNNSKIYLGLIHRDTINLNTTTGPVSFPATQHYDILVMTLNMSGDIERAFGVKGDLKNEINDMVLDKEENIYLGGYFEGNINFAHASQTPVAFSAVGDDDAFIAKYTPDGLLQWVNVYPSEDYSYISNLAIARGTEVYFTGGTTGRTDLDPGPGVLNYVADFQTDLILGKLDTEGNQLYVYAFSGSSTEGSRSIIISEERSEVFISGFYYASLDCDFTEEDATITTKGGSDGFRIVFDEENVTTAVDQSGGLQNLSIYPNPVNDILQITNTEIIDLLTVQSPDGRIVYSKYINAPLAKIDMSQLAGGMYVINAFAKNKVTSTLVVVQK